MKSVKSVFLFILIFSSVSCQSTKESDPSPRIINIINFIRQTDYRLENADSLMFDAVEKQIELLGQYDFPATFLFQYDALINPEYQELMRNRLSQQCEIGAWWEITQPHVEAAGIKWRGEHSWVSTANIAFTTGYTPEEREKLVDVYMNKFREIYGDYPKSVGSWYIDSHTLAYMYDKYGIVASCNCKDQVGTDGYTLWGGYWNQAYYPSRKNGYMPAQSVEEQIPVPVFRMLGSDPMYQYDNGVGGNGQGVISLEPVYRDSGKNKKWVDYFFESIVNGPSLAFNYAQAGQENSFTWAGMGEGLEMQFPIIDSLRTVGKIRLETLGASGKWFREHFQTTPATAVTTLTDVRDKGNKSVWYNSRYYRTNLFWENDGFCFRDIHLFNENFESEYLNTPGTGGQFYYYTLPVIDRFHWSTRDELTGLRIVKIDDEGKKQRVVLKDPIVTETSKTTLKVESKDQDDTDYIILLKEDKIEISCKAKAKDMHWFLELEVPQERMGRLPFKNYEPSSISSSFRGFDYKINIEKGSIIQGENSGFVFRVAPVKNRVIISGVTNI